jgi:hypothetical protein
MSTYEELVGTISSNFELVSEDSFRPRVNIAKLPTETILPVLETKFIQTKFSQKAGMVRVMMPNSTDQDVYMPSTFEKKLTNDKLVALIYKGIKESVRPNKMIITYHDYKLIFKRADGSTYAK